MNQIKKRIRTNSHQLLYFCIFLLFLISMHLWIGWDAKINIRLVFGIGLLMLICVIWQGISLDINKKNVCSFLALCIGYIYIYPGSIISFITFILPSFVLVFLNSRDRVICLNFIFKWYAWLMIPSFIVYLLVQLTDLPSFGELYFNNEFMPWGYSHRENYIFYTYSSLYDYRFNGPFLEPGHLGMMSSFLLFATGFNIKRTETWIHIIAIAFSLSLAGYFLAFLGYVMVGYLKNRLSLSRIFLFVIGVLGIYLSIVFYNNGDNVLNERIVSRMQSDKEVGFAGNNRSFGLIPLMYVDMWNDPNTLWWGYGVEELKHVRETGKGGGTGYVTWMVTYGLIGTFMALLYYLIYFIFNRDFKNSVTFLVFVFFMFWQRSYSFWFSWLICYTWGITCAKYWRNN